ncbi:MAG TPA: hypothetical protein VFW05_01280 [Verrucomicrobiae bacterium]|nr:hypothetical protein [Verrucomicrobiae bacterium]
MQIPRRILFACVATTILSLNFSQAQDTEAQRKARAALEQALNPAGAQSATEATPAPKTEPPAAKPAAPAASQAPAAQPAPQISGTHRASDDAIEKAREALRQKMNELSNATAPEQAPVQAQKPAAETPVATPAPAVIQEPSKQTTATPAPAHRASDEAIEKAREALRQKMSELENTAPAEPATTSAPAVVQQPATETPAMQENIFQTPPPAVSENDVEKAREALREKMSEIEKQKAAAKTEVVSAPANKEPEKAEQPKVEKAEKSKEVTRRKDPNAFPPLSAPPTGLTAEQEQRLAELLEQYKADKLTPDQYHEARAKVLANH